MMKILKEHWKMIKIEMMMMTIIMEKEENEKIRP